MNLKNDRTTTTLIALFLTLIIAVVFVPVPSTYAQPTQVTYAFLGVNKNPVGVGQEVLLHVGITQGLGATADGWTDLTVTVEMPDGNTQTLGPFKTDSTRGTGTIFVPTMADTYYLQTNFPAQDYFWPPFSFVSPIGMAGGIVHYKASTSEKVALVVTIEPLVNYPGVALPTEYWTRPIDSQAREWYTIAGSWVTVPPNRYAPYNEGPETTHILWTKPITSGGLAGGELGLVGSGPTSVGMETGDAYEGYFKNSVILNGKLYYNRYKSSFGGAGIAGGFGLEEEVVCVDLHTGEELWVRNWDNAKLAFGQNFYFDSYNYHGTFPLLWTTEGGGGGGPFGPAVPESWNAYDPFNGRWTYRMVGVPSGTNIYGPNGAIYRYYTDMANGWMMLWNTSAVVSEVGSFGSAMLGQTFNVSMVDWNTRPHTGYEWNKTIPTGLPGSPIVTYLEDRMIGASIAGGFGGQGPVTFWGIDLKPGHEGELLFEKTWMPPQENLTVFWTTASQEDGVFIIAGKEIRGLFGFSMDTGDLLWGPTDPQHYLNIYTISEPRATTRLHLATAYGKVFSPGVSGIVYCYDVKTGELEWTYEARDTYTESLFSSSWWMNIAFITDGKIYLTHDEHSPVQPLPRGAPSVCLNATTGDVIWRADGLFRGTYWGDPPIIGDSIMAAMDTYDMRLYGVGKGPTMTNVAAAPKVSTLGSSVLLEGSVTDVSPGTKDPILMARFPHGVPAVSDGDMSAWMLYVYKQFEMPMVSGVPVKLEVVVDPNGNWYDIGTAYTDASGFYSIAWEPPVPGHYLILATFDGSKAYYSSYMETAVVVDEGLTPGTLIEFEEPASLAQATEEPTTLEESTEPEQPAETPLITTEVAIIAGVAVIAIVGVAAYWLIKRK